jgi:putative heme-binding domain-containing protein
VTARLLLALLLLQGDPIDLPALKRTFLDGKADPKARAAAAAALAADREGAHFLIGLASEERFPRELETAVAGPIFRNADFAVRALASRWFKRPAAGDKPMPALADLARLKGDAANGKKVFFGAAAACSKCHLFEGEGGDVGPNLTEIRGKYDRARLLDSILNPSAEIAFGFEAVLLLSQDGEVYSGIVLADGDEVVLKESTGAQRPVPVGKIRVRKKLETSLMPDNAAVGLSPQDLADLATLLLGTNP